jgi:hypothetical protein
MTIITQPYAFSDVKVKFNTILKDTKNIRTQRDPKQDQRLQERIHTTGLRLPLFIGKTKTREQFILVFGHRRHDVLEEAGYGEKNPLIDCILISPLDDPDRPLEAQEIRDLRMDDEFFWLKVTDYDKLMAVAEKTEEELAKGRSISQIAKEDFGKSEGYIRNIRNALRIPAIHNALKDGLISLHDSFNLLNIDEEAIRTLIEARDTLTSREFADACKQARNGVPAPSAIESVKHPELTVKEEALPEEKESASHHFDPDGKPSSETPIDELPVEEEGGSESEKDEEKQPPSETDDIPGQDFGRELISGKKPEREDCPTCNGNAYLKQGGSQFLCPDCHGKGFVLDEKPEREAQPSSESPLEVGTEPSLDTEPEEDPEPPEEVEKPERKKDEFPIVSKIVKRFEFIKKLSEDDDPRKTMSKLPQEKRKTAIRTSRKIGESWLCQSARYRSASNGERYEASKIISALPFIKSITTEDIESVSDIEKSQCATTEMQKALETVQNALAKKMEKIEPDQEEMM